jgi:hypothetical protein
MPIGTPASGNSSPVNPEPDPSPKVLSPLRLGSEPPISDMLCGCPRDSGGSHLSTYDRDDPPNVICSDGSMPSLILMGTFGSTLCGSKASTASRAVAECS